MGPKPMLGNNTIEVLQNMAVPMLWYSSECWALNKKDDIWISTSKVKFGWEQLKDALWGTIIRSNYHKWAANHSFLGKIKTRSNAYEVIIKGYKLVDKISGQVGGDIVIHKRVLEFIPVGKRTQDEVNTVVGFRTRTGCEAYILVDDDDWFDVLGSK